ncbi:TetR/AcrR family transcriptional regulator [Candidatus Sulfidibacterium hydrothermale]|uniref:TetR/AcrR family transcriptional regulator n=1 Tax=Candidatus Sulfidibacterium hydrothermale TaxID=2875962 RepID=UPI001F0B20A2|nr:TetR/AcrR family transcriptional regulator [Candidatus Sulfidibacterium hydrothermale]UBM62385.1 TetR/AcrR family transcriptional regulator [Candidatus Sulfidibacterium hydrothermale]
MEVSDTYNGWITKGYEYFAEVGPIQFSVKELSKRTGFSRTSFHYYFNSKEEYFDVLLDYHFENVIRFNFEVKNHKNLRPEDFAVYLDEYSTGVRFHQKLFNHRKLDRFNRAYIKGHEINIEYGLLEWVMKIFGLHLPHEKAKKVYYIFTDVLNTRYNILEREPQSDLKYSDIFLETVDDFKILFTS